VCIVFFWGGGGGALTAETRLTKYMKSRAEKL